MQPVEEAGAVSEGGAEARAVGEALPVLVGDAPIEGVLRGELVAAALSEAPAEPVAKAEPVGLEVARAVALPLPLGAALSVAAGEGDAAGDCEPPPEDGEAEGLDEALRAGDADAAPVRDSQPDASALVLAQAVLVADRVGSRLPEPLAVEGALIDGDGEARPLTEGEADTRGLAEALPQSLENAVAETEGGGEREAEPGAVPERAAVGGAVCEGGALLPLPDALCERVSVAGAEGEALLLWSAVAERIPDGVPAGRLCEGGAEGEPEGPPLPLTPTLGEAEDDELVLLLGSGGSDRVAVAAAEADWFSVGAPEAEAAVEKDAAPLEGVGDGEGAAESVAAD